MNKFISTFADENDEVHYRDFLENLRTFSYKSECPDVASSITTYKQQEDPIPYDTSNDRNEFVVLNI